MKRMETYKFNNGGKGLVGFILLLLAKQLQGQGPICDNEIRVSRNTVVQALIMENLMITCDVTFCTDPPQVTWCKLDEHICNPVIQTTHIQTQWKSLTSNSGISVLTFSEVSMDDAGLYRCTMPSMVSHSIAVIVNDITCKTEVSLSDDCWWRAPISVSVTVSCGVSFRVEPRMSWCREDGDTCLPLKSQSRHTLTWNHTGPGTGVSYLTLHNITLSDSGYYHCYVSLPDYCGPNTRISRPLKLNVTRSGEVFEHCGEDDHPVILDSLNFVDDFTILFMIATLVVMTLILCWFLKARGKCSPPEGNEVELPRVEPEQNIPPDTERGAEDPDEVYDDCV
ncbi:uncharacterized protein LOC121558380 [Coregonus clupeaformis]|uniref:uncharacterized protein LOC121558380 n=1 Tax=Coregonus clupeaformis TaxID=59861 RepID=UPI001E1C98CA|nr:uncharacterized protein LOC121558380 [Coregonus clupeaformis]